MQDICFGWDRQTDEQSLKKFIHQFSSNKLLDTLIPRLTEAEITILVDTMSKLMRSHLSEKEYHQLFLSRSKGKRMAG